MDGSSVLSIPGFSGYEVSDKGEVFSSRRGTRKKKKPRKRWDGYFDVNLFLDGKWRKFLIHRLVLLSFIGPCPRGYETRHLDGNKENNCLSNICWGTKEENEEDKTAHGTRQSSKGEKNGNCFLSDLQVKEIRRRYASEKIRQSDLAKEYGVSQTAISFVINKRKISS
jgi:hypothetical protein